MWKLRGGKAIISATCGSSYSSKNTAGIWCNQSFCTKTYRDSHFTGMRQFGRGNIIYKNVMYEFSLKIEK